MTYDSNSSGTIITSSANSYATLAQFRERLTMPSTDTSADTDLQLILTSVSRWIDNFTGRRFYTAEETRYFTADDSDELWIDDITAVTSLATDPDGDRTYDTTWSATDYDLTPTNATLEDRPYTKLVIAPNGSYGFPSGVKKGVKLVGSYGYTSSTQSGRGLIIREACLLQSERIYKRKDTPLGIAGSPALGEQSVAIPGLDPDIKGMLEPFMHASRFI